MLWPTIKLHLKTNVLKLKRKQHTIGKNMANILHSSFERKTSISTDWKRPYFETLQNIKIRVQTQALFQTFDFGLKNVINLLDFAEIKQLKLLLSVILLPAANQQSLPLFLSSFLHVTIISSFQLPSLNLWEIVHYSLLISDGLEFLEYTPSDKK